MDLSMAFCLLLSLESIQSQQPINVYVSVNGNTISDDPILIYHDEIEFGPSPPTVDTIDSQGAVVCRSENHVTANWRSPSGRFLPTEGDVYKQVESENVSIDIPSFSQLSTPNDDRQPIDGRVVIPNGLWLCQVDNDDIPDQDIIESFKFVGIYNRGYGAIDTVTVSIVNSSDFMGDPPTFTLIADISGGPPVTYTWGRNSNTLITKSRGPYDFSLEVNGVNTLDVESVSPVLQESRYRSTLTVTGNLPGRYGFHVINRAMMNYKRDSIYIRGGILRDLTAEQNNLTTVLITWTKPFIPWSLDPDDDSLELDIVIHLPDGNNIIYYDEESPIIFNTTMLGVHTVQEMYFSQQLPTPEIMFTVKGHGPATINVSLRTSILANLTFFFPSELNLPVVQYVVTVSRVTGSSPWQELCPEVVDNKPTVTTTAASITFTGLEEFSTYTVALTTTFDVFGSNVDEVTPQMIFTTLSAAPTGVPRDVVVVSRTSRSFMVTWDVIECIERNGIILRYRVNSNATIGSTSGRNFLAEGLSPYKQYSFQVAGMTDDSTGPFTDTITITTDEGVPGPVSYLTGLAKFTSVDLTWSAPQEPNGVIISYEVTYTVAGITHIINTGLSTTFIIPSLPPRTTVSGLSVRAYTKVGRGEAATIVDQKTLGNSIVKNVEVDTLSATAVRVSWDRVVLPEVNGYIVYYAGDRKRKSITVTSSVNSVDIEGLLDTLEYEFRVAVIAEINGKEFIGDIPLDLNLFEAISTTCTRNCRIVVGVIFSYFVIMILVTTLLFYRVRMYRLKIISKSRSERVRLLSIQQHTSEFKIDANETLEQNPDINLPQTTDFKINADKTLEHDKNPDINQQQKTNFKIDADETLECGENPDVNQQQITDFKIDADEKKLECGQNSDINQQQTISSRNDADKTLEHDQNPDTNQQQTTDFKIDADETLECVNQQQTISSGNNADETLEHDQNTDTNQQQTTDFKIDADETLECGQNSEQQIISSGNNADETLEHDQNPDINQQQNKIDADEETLESDQNSEKQTILSGSDADETLEHDQDSDNNQLHNFKIDTDETKSSEHDHDQDI